MTINSVCKQTLIALKISKILLESNTLRKIRIWEKNDKIHNSIYKLKHNLITAWNNPLGLGWNKKEFKQIYGGTCPFQYIMVWCH